LEKCLVKVAVGEDRKMQVKGGEFGEMPGQSGSRRRQENAGKRWRIWRNAWSKWQ